MVKVRPLRKNRSIMLSPSQSERIENVLLDEVVHMRNEYRGGRCSKDQFARTLRRFNQFILSAEIPPDLLYLASEVQGIERISVDSEKRFRSRRTSGN